MGGLLSEEAWATLVDEDQSFDYETKGVGRDVVSDFRRTT
jgi:hypothetical protein